MSYLDWKVGDKVVCVDNSRPPNYHGVLTVLPEIGVVYTIRRIAPFTWSTGTSGVGVWLEEITRSTKNPRGSEQPWGASRFRPVQTRKTDISIFTAMLKPSKVTA
jgi:hypothetical protein